MINITIDDLTLQTIIGEAVTYDHETDEEISQGGVTLGERVAQIIAKDVMKHPEYQSLRERVTQIRTEMIREMLLPILTDALNGPIHKTNTYGERTGSTTTLTEMIMQEAQKAWTPANDRYNSRSESLNDVINKTVKAQLTDAVAKTVKETREAALKALADVTNKPVMDALREALNSKP